MIEYSATNNACYDMRLNYSNLPDDLVEITHDEHNIFMGENWPDGKRLVKNKYPFEFEDIPPQLIEVCRCAKLAEMRKECDDAIATIFQSDAIGVDKTYSYDCTTIAQDNLKMIVLVGNGGSIYVHDGQWFNEVVHTHAQSVTLLADMLEHIRVQRFDKLKPIIAAINAAVTNDDVNAIAWL